MVNLCNGIDWIWLWIGLSIGVGGVIIWLLDREKEWDEVLIKVKFVVGRIEDGEWYVGDGIIFSYLGIYGFIIIV